MATFIYKPKGKAAEYGDYALNIYMSCTHKCFYCYCPSVLRKDKDDFYTNPIPRVGIVDGVKNQLKSNGMKGKVIHLCFIGDPYPNGADTSVTREIIKVIKDSGNHVQILTKNGLDAMRDFDLLDENDWFGISYAGYPGDSYTEDIVPEAEPGAGSPYWRIKALETAHNLGIKTWVSCEPVINDIDVLLFIERTNFVDLWKVGKLNYYPSDINWKDFGIKVETLLEKKQANTRCEYYIKESLRKEIDK